MKIREIFKPFAEMFVTKGLSACLEEVLSEERQRKANPVEKFELPSPMPSAEQRTLHR